jgi:hypothetical protein
MFEARITLPQPGPKAKAKVGAKRKKASGRTSASALRSSETKKRLQAEREALAAKVEPAAAPNGNGAGALVKPPRMLSKHDPKLAPATALLRSRLAENPFIPIDELRRAAVAANIDGNVLASAAAHLNLKVGHRGSTEGFELKG